MSRSERIFDLALEHDRERAVYAAPLKQDFPDRSRARGAIRSICAAVNVGKISL